MARVCALTLISQEMGIPSSLMVKESSSNTSSKEVEGSGLKTSRSLAAAVRSANRRKRLEKRINILNDMQQAALANVEKLRKLIADTADSLSVSLSTIIVDDEQEEDEGDGSAQPEQGLAFAGDQEAESEDLSLRADMDRFFGKYVEEAFSIIARFRGKASGHQL